MMTKRRFAEVYTRQQESGLCIKDFCENEGFSTSGFYFWKSKFGLDKKRVDEGLINDERIIPVAIKSSMPTPTTKVFQGQNSLETSASPLAGEISIELPGGTKMKFSGSSQMHALELITKIFSDHVLPK